MKVVMVLIGVVAALLIGAAMFQRQPPPSSPQPPQPQSAVVAEPAESPPPAAPADPAASPRPRASQAREGFAAPPPPEPAAAPFSKAERLAQIRETFRALAAGEPRTALRAARQLADETERETALLALVTEWNHGELSPPRQRAWAVASLGLEAGVGAELAGNPELAQVWASELTNGQSRTVSPERLAPAMFDADPAAALAFGQQLSAADRRKFFDSAFSNWAQRDTETALQWAEQLSDPTEREAALRAIRSVAPVGIGVELGLQDGYPVINRMFPGMPAELSGQLHPGDRILAIAQGNNVFVDAHRLPMQELVQAIRGTPGTLLQLRVLSADAAPDASPRTIAVVRGQIMFKR